MTECPECGEAGGAHAPGCSLARFENAPVPPRGAGPPAGDDPQSALLEQVRDEVRALRRMVALGLVLLVLWMLVWAVVAGG